MINPTIASDPTPSPAIMRNRTPADGANSVGANNPRLAEALEVRDAFTTFLGETFFRQMIKSMRSSLDKPAYFHGGRGEEIFQSQLDEQFAKEMTESSAEQFARPLFEHQFPHLAQMLDAHDKSQPPRTSTLDVSG